MNKMTKSVIVIAVFLAVVCGAWYVSVSQVQETSMNAEKENNAVTEYAEPDLESLSYYELDPFETTLPVVYIDTKGQQIRKENKIWASIAILDAAEDGSTRSILEVPDSEEAITIKYRGASSYSQFDKKQYRIKFYKKEGSTKAVNREFLGMGANSEWVLNGPFLDKTLIRNRMAYSLAREIFEWAPDSQYVEVFLDGEYQGVYLAVEPVTNGEARLRLSEFGLLSGETSYIVKRDRIGTEDEPLEVYGKTANITYNDLYVEYPSASNLTKQQRDWIENDISRFEKALYAEHFADAEIGYPAYIDVDNFVDYVVFNEVWMNNDAGNLSTYVYKELTGKMKLAVWDFNNALDNYQWFSQDFTKFFTADRSWLSRLLQDRSFVDKVVERYRELRKGVLSDAYLEQRIQQCQEELGDAVDRNFAVWGYTFRVDLLSFSDVNRNPSSYEEAINQLRSALTQRLTFLDGNIELLYENCVN